MIVPTPAGFRNAPVTKGWLLAMGGWTLATALFGAKSPAAHGSPPPPPLDLRLHPHVTHYYQFWRIPLSQFAFESSSELVFGYVLIYNLRMLERNFGTAKYAAFLTVSHVLTMVLSVGALAVGARHGLTYLPAGPYGVLYSALYQYYATVASTREFWLFGLDISDKVFVYLLATQLLVTRPPGSIVAGLTGLLAGAMYSANLACIKRWRCPSVIRRLASKLLLPLLASSSSGSAGGDAAGSPSPRLNRRRPRPEERLREPTDEEVATLAVMFPAAPRDAIVEALRATDGSLDAAVEILLSVR